MAAAALEYDQLLKRDTDLEGRFEQLEREYRAATEAASRQGSVLGQLEKRLAEFETRAAVQDRKLAERDGAVATLDADLLALRTHANTLTADLGEAQARAQSLAAELHARDAAVVTLRSELAAHVEALGAIRRDINRIENGRPTDTPPAPMRYLIAVDSSDVVHVLNRKVMSIGRTAESDLQIRASHISRHHARLLVGPTAVILEDLGSTNGCYVNGRRVKKQLLQNDDILMIGKTRFRFTARTTENASH